MTAESTRREHHLVSNGYQKNFADGVWVTVVDVATARVLHTRRSTKTNWKVRDFLSVPDGAGTFDDALEKELSRRETVVLNSVRDIEAFTAPSVVQRKSLDTLAAMHLVRSQAFDEKRRAVTENWLRNDVPGFVTHPRLTEKFIQSYGREPYDGELEALVARAGSEIASDPGGLAHSVRDGLKKLEMMLSKHEVQLIAVDEQLPGLILADVPVLHGRRREGVFGFEAAGAVGDADTILVPVSRRLLASYSHRPLRDFRIGTKNGLDRVNALLAHGARREVICHPDDARDTVNMIRNKHRFEPRLFDRATIR